VGDNGVGKTNILDAIYYLSFTKSYFNSVAVQNIRHGEGFFMVTLKGTGTIYLQSLPFSRLANRIIASAPNIGGKRKGEGSVLGMVGDMMDGR